MEPSNFDPKIKGTQNPLRHLQARKIQPLLILCGKEYKQVNL